jgi:hypothetical protein
MLMSPHQIPGRCFCLPTCSVTVRSACWAQGAAKMLDEWQARPSSRLGKLLAVMTSWQLSSQFGQVLKELELAFSTLNGVVSIGHAHWPQQDLRAALAADMQQLVAEITQRGPAAQAELQVAIRQPGLFCLKRLGSGAQCCSLGAVARR